MATGQVWLADRAFCTEVFLGQIKDRGAYSMICQHGQLRFAALQAMRLVESTAAGQDQISEQWVQRKPRADGRESVRLQRIRVELDASTRHGEDELYVLNSVPEVLADVTTLARLYRQRWTIEHAFLHLTMQLRCEVQTLSYRPAALFALACAMAIFNVLATVKAALRAAHGAAVEARLSSHAMATHMRAMAESLETIVEPGDWRVFTPADTQALAQWLLEQAQRVPLARYAKAPMRKSPAKPAGKRQPDPHKPHVSLTKLLAAAGIKAP